MSVTNDRPLTLAIIGAGQRGKAYARYAIEHPEKCKVLAVAEPRPQTRALMVQAHSITPEYTFESFEAFFAASEVALGQTGKLFVDAVVVCVQDQMHAQVVTALAKHKYPILCEKPMATTPEECIMMADAVKQAGQVFGCGHVLRYSPYSQSIANILRNHELGEIVNVQHIEPIGYFHFSHSYVRGNWSIEKDSSFSLLTKSCHDIDIICSYFAHFGATPVKVSSFGSLTHFKKANKPKEAGAATRCLDCPVKDTCTYSAKRIYYDPVARGSKEWPAAVIVDGLPDIENIGEALKNGPYGQCVYESPNDVVDHQVVNIEFSGGQTCAFTMVAYTEKICDRETRIHFTNGELIGDMKTFTTTYFTRLNVLGKDERAAAGGVVASEIPGSKPARVHHKPTVDEMSGHGGGDIGLIAAFVEAVKAGKQEILDVTVDDILNSHLTVFAAETSRREGRIVDVKEYEASVRKGMAAMRPAYA
ncbi:streptomycin biosynthesis protein StrI [Clavulina sp. PMI_390]|nr:streptomycin biosynthesis protein StrI [Clavulina sp. PMI_390]